MLRDHTLLNPTRNSRKSNKSMPCRRGQHDTRTEKSPDRSSNLTDDRNSSDDGSNGLGPDTTAKSMEQTAPPGHAVRPNRRSTRLSAPREGEKEEARGPQAGKEEEQEEHNSQHRVQGKARPRRR